MKPTTFVAAIAVLTATISTPILAGDREHDHGMQVVANNAAPDAPGYGRRTVCILTRRRAPAPCAAKSMARSNLGLTLARQRKSAHRDVECRQFWRLCDQIYQDANYRYTAAGQ